MKKFFYESPIGKIWIVEKENQLYSILYNDTIECEISKTPLLENTVLQLSQYFNGERKIFDIPILLEGTEFQKKVWQTLMKIPYGKTVSYGDIAEQIGHPRASRAVGGANNKNRIPIVIPCHRVIGKNGKFVGYAGGLDKKEFLLNLEFKYLQNL